MLVPVDYSSEYVLQKSFFGGGGRIGSLVSHLGILYDDFEKLIAAGKLIKVCSWYNNLRMCVKTHRYHSITWIAFDKSLAPFQWEHLPRHQIIG